MSAPAVGLIQSCHASCTDKACVGVKWSWKELRLSQPAAPACPDHTASALWLNSPVSTLFLLAYSKCRTVHMAPEGWAFFKIKNEAEDYGWEKYQKDIPWSFPYLPFSPRFLRCVMPLPKGRLARGSWSFFAVMRALLRVAAEYAARWYRCGMLVALSLHFGCFGLK